MVGIADTYLCRTWITVAGNKAPMAKMPGPGDWKKALGKDVKAIVGADGVTRALTGLEVPTEVKLEGDLDKAIKTIEARLKLLPIALKAAGTVKAKNKANKENEGALEFIDDLIE